MKCQMSYRPPLPYLLRAKPIHRVFGFEIDVKQNLYFRSPMPPS